MKRDRINNIGLDVTEKEYENEIRKIVKAWDDENNEQAKLKCAEKIKKTKMKLQTSIATSAAKMLEFQDITPRRIDVIFINLYSSPLGLPTEFVELTYQSDTFTCACGTMCSSKGKCRKFQINVLNEEIICDVCWGAAKGKRSDDIPICDTLPELMHEVIGLIKKN